MVAFAIHQLTGGGAGRLNAFAAAAAAPAAPAAPSQRLQGSSVRRLDRKCARVARCK